MPSESQITAADLITGCLLCDSVLPASCLEPCLKEASRYFLEEDPRALMFRRGERNHCRLNNAKHNIIYGSTIMPRPEQFAK